MATETTLGSAGRRRRRGAGTLRLALTAALLGGVVSAGGTVAPSPAIAREAAPATAAVVPESALVYLAANLDLDSDQWRRVEGLLGRVGLPTAVDDGRRLIEEELRRDPTTAGIDLDDLLGGELGIVISEPAISALAQSPTTGDPATASSLDAIEAASPPASPTASAAAAPASGVAAILSAGDPAAAFALLEEELRADGARSGAGIEEIDYRGTEIVANGGGTALARVDDLVLVANTPADLEPLIDTAAGETPALIAFGPMTEALAALNDESALFGFVNGERVGDALAGLGLDPEALDTALEAVSPNAAGAASLDFHAGFVLWADDPGLRFDTVVVPPPGGALPAAPDGIETTADERVTADALFFTSGNDLGADGSLDLLALGIASALAEGVGETPATPVVGIADAVSPETIDELFADAERTLGFDLRADLFDQPAGEYVLAVSAGDVFRGEGFGFVLASGVDKPPVVAAALRRIARLVESAGADAVDVRTRQVEGETVFVARARGMEDGVTVTSPPLEFGVVGNEMVIGLGSGLDDYTAGPTEPLADDEQFRRVMATLPSETYRVTYLDLRFVASPLGALLGSIDRSPTGAGPVDADPACAAYDGEAAAQAAYDADPIANGELDGDFDDLACEDFFAATGAAATPVDPAAGGSDANLSALKAVGFAAFGEGDTLRSSTILYVAEEAASAVATPAP
jgi:hypothetical protein